MKKVVGYTKILLATLLLISGAMSLFPVPVYAIADPDTPPTINSVYVYEDLLETGDCGILVDYYLDYAVPPTETANEAYLTVFVDTDGTTQLRSVAPYVFQNSGYDRGITWIYFDAADVIAHSIDSANEALYRVWLVGNPTLAWPGDPPKTTATIDYWQPADTSTNVLLSLRILTLADLLELEWSLDLVGVTTLGNRLTSLGESYFENVIPNLRSMAPNCFASAILDPIYEDIDYTTEFGAVATDGTGTIAVSPTTLVAGSQSLNVTGVGTIIFTLEHGTVGTVTNDVGTVVGSPVALVDGINTVTANGIGNVTVLVNLVNTQTALTDTVTGTGLDLTDIATIFGVSRLMFSGLIWMIVSIIICAAVYMRAGSKTVLLVFDLCVIGGAVLGLVHVLVAALLFIGFGAFTAYILFFRGANA